MGECFFWYRPTRVVPDQRPLNGRCCCLSLRAYNFPFLQILPITIARIVLKAPRRRRTCDSQSRMENTAATCDRPLRRCVNLSRRQHLRNALFDALRQLSGTHCRKLFSIVTLLQFLSLGLRHSSSLRLSLLSLLTNTLPGPSASKVTTLRRYTNLFIIIIIF